MTITLRTDPKREPGAYLSFEGNLYRVINYRQTGPSSGTLRVENALTLEFCSLTSMEMRDAKLERGPAEPLELTERAA
jgi:hypothetical protein